MVPSTPSFRAWGVKTAQISWRNDATWLEKVASTAARQLVATTDVKMKYRKWWLNYNPSIDGVIFCSVAEILQDWDLQTQRNPSIVPVMSVQWENETTSSLVWCQMLASFWSVPVMLTVALWDCGCCRTDDFKNWWQCRFPLDMYMVYIPGIRYPLWSHRDAHCGSF